MKRQFTKYPSKVTASTVSSDACYIDNYSKWDKPINTLNNIMDMANRWLKGSGLSVPGIDSIGIADNGQLLGFYNLYKTKSGNWYSILWQGGEWKLSIYDEVDAETLKTLYEVLDTFNHLFRGIRFHEDRPLIGKNGVE